MSHVTYNGVRHFNTKITGKNTMVSGAVSDFDSDYSLRMTTHTTGFFDGMCDMTRTGIAENESTDEISDQTIRGNAIQIPKTAISGESIHPNALLKEGDPSADYESSDIFSTRSCYTRYTHNANSEQQYHQTNRVHRDHSQMPDGSKQQCNEGGVQQTHLVEWQHRHKYLYNEHLLDPRNHFSVEYYTAMKEKQRERKLETVRQHIKGREMEKEMETEREVEREKERVCEAEVELEKESAGRNGVTGALVFTQNDRPTRNVHQKTSYYDDNDPDTAATGVNNDSVHDNVHTDDRYDRNNVSLVDQVLSHAHPQPPSRQDFQSSPEYYNLMQNSNIAVYSNSHVRYNTINQHFGFGIPSASPASSSFQGTESWWQDMMIDRYHTGCNDDRSSKYIEGRMKQQQQQAHHGEGSGGVKATSESAMINTAEQQSTLTSSLADAMPINVSQHAGDALSVRMGMLSSTGAALALSHTPPYYRHPLGEGVELDANYYFCCDALDQERADDAFREKEEEEHLQPGYRQRRHDLDKEVVRRLLRVHPNDHGGLPPPPVAPGSPFKHLTNHRYHQQQSASARSVRGGSQYHSAPPADARSEVVDSLAQQQAEVEEAVRQHLLSSGAQWIAEGPLPRLVQHRAARWREMQAAPRTQLVRHHCHSNMDDYGFGTLTDDDVNDIDSKGQSSAASFKAKETAKKETHNRLRQSSFAHGPASPRGGFSMENAGDRDSSVDNTHQLKRPPSMLRLPVLNVVMMHQAKHHGDKQTPCLPGSLPLQQRQQETSAPLTDLKALTSTSLPPLIPPDARRAQSSRERMVYGAHSHAPFKTAANSARSDRMFSEPTMITSVHISSHPDATAPPAPFVSTPWRHRASDRWLHHASTVDAASCAPEDFLHRRTSADMLMTVARSATNYYSTNMAPNSTSTQSLPHSKNKVACNAPECERTMDQNQTNAKTAATWGIYNISGYSETAAADNIPFDNRYDYRGANDAVSDRSRDNDGTDSPLLPLFDLADVDDENKDDQDTCSPLLPQSTATGATTASDAMLITIVPTDSDLPMKKIECFVSKFASEEQKKKRAARCRGYPVGISMDEAVRQQKKQRRTALQLWTHRLGLPVPGTPVKNYSVIKTK